MTMTLYTFTPAAAAILAGQCEPGHAALVMVTRREPMSWCFGSYAAICSAAEGVAADADPEVLLAAVVTPDGAVATYLTRLYPPETRT
jgi:hypothetical protein